MCVVTTTVAATIILFSHGSFKIRHLLTELHTPLSELDSKVDSAFSDLSLPLLFMIADVKLGENG